MDLRSLRALVSALSFSTHGVPVTVTWTDPEIAPVETTGIWDHVLEEEWPMGNDFQRSEPRRLLVLPRNVIATLPRGTTITASERAETDVKTWKVDGLGRFEPESWRAILVVSRQPT